jgi:molybdopterin-binding protein
MIVSAKNQLRGKIIRISDGAVNSEVLIELTPGVEITSIITKSSVENLKLSEGKEVYAVIKASNVMIGIEH